MVCSYRISQAEFIDSVCGWINQVFDAVLNEVNTPGDKELVRTLRNQFRPGKMLRTRLGYALCGDTNNRLDEIVKACAATELIHTATLFHDDVIDGASLRRGQPSLWKEIGSTGAILLGDLFFSSSLGLVVASGNIQHIRSFVTKVREVCAKEMVHELVYKGREVDGRTCLDIARGKTGPLFAFIGEVCGGHDARKAQALCEAGYHLGAAYQIADDLIDVTGSEELIGKTLGTDRKRRKFTLAQADNVSEFVIADTINTLCKSAVELVGSWPDLLPGLEEYIVSDLLPFQPIKLNGTRHTTVA